jgi:hypothetical protein
MIGWQPAFEPSGIIFSDMPIGPGIKDIYKLTDIRTVTKVQTPGSGFNIEA